MKALIVDDEQLARRGIAEMLRQLDTSIAVVEAEGGSAAVKLIGEIKPDVVFLDIEMPGTNGFKVVEEVGVSRMPPVIFVTAYNEHALKAFEAHAIDYLLKPVDPDRLRDALERARRIKSSADLELLGRHLSIVASAINRSSSSTPGNDRILVRDGGRIVFLDRGDINWVESQGNYVKVHVAGASLTHRSTLEEFHTVLGPAFIRIRRSALVRKEAIRLGATLGRGAYVLTLSDKTRITSRRHYRDQLSTLLGD